MIGNIVLDWTINVGTMIHMVVLLAGVIGAMWRFWVGVKNRLGTIDTRMVLIEREIAAFREDRIEIKLTLKEVNDKTQRMREDQAGTAATINAIMSRLHGRKLSENE